MQTPPGPPPPPRSSAGGFSRAIPAPTASRPEIKPPAVGGTISQASKDAIAESALDLLEEQIQARIVHYKEELETNPELDAITAGVVAELRRMQEQLSAQSARGQDQRDAVLVQQERKLLALLERFFPRGAPSLIVEKRIKHVLRNLARLFFQSELHEHTRGAETTRVIQHGEQAVFYLLSRYNHRLTNELNNFEFISPEVRERSHELLQKLGKDMQDAFLSRRSSELKRIVGGFSAVLVEFVSAQLPPALPELAHEVIHQSASGEGKAYGYKIVESAFARFRATFERRIMVRLVSFAEDELIRRLADTAGAAREDTIKFITNPEIFSMMVGEIARGAYEYLCNEGFLDLPPEWVNAELG